MARRIIQTTACILAVCVEASVIAIRMYFGRTSLLPLVLGPCLCLVLILMHLMQREDLLIVTLAFQAFTHTIPVIIQVITNTYFSRINRIESAICSACSYADSRILSTSLCQQHCRSDNDTQNFENWKAIVFTVYGCAITAHLCILILLRSKRAR